MFSDIKDIFKFVKSRKKWWLLPIIITLLIIGAIIIIGSTSALAPYIYTLF